MPTILIGADICPIERNLPYFTAGDGKALVNDLSVEFEAADLCLANLECPLIEAPTPIRKTGPTFGESSACIRGIREAGIDVLGLANNHIMDHGAAGLKNTLDVCARAGIATVGAGSNLDAARRLLIKDVEGVRVGMLAVAEHEFSIAKRDSWGANPLDVIEYVRNVRDNKSSFDYLIVLIHGAHEFFSPTPRIKQTCRFMIEMGANAVIVQHPHCLGCYENYEGGHIVYGQGALILDEAVYRDLRSFHEGFLVKLSIAGDVSSTMEIVPFVQSDPVPGARRMSSDQERQFQCAVKEKSRAVLDDAFVEAEWLRFCEQRRFGYLSSLLGHNRILRKLNIHGFATQFLHGKRSLLGVKNVVCCETHREAVETILQTWVLDT